MVLGPRGLSGIGGFLIGSVGMAVIARTETPVVLARSGEQAADEHEKDSAAIASAATAYRPVVLGLGTGRPDDEVIAFAFEEAARRSTTPKVVHGWNLPRYYAYGLPRDPGLHAEVGRQEAAAPAEVLRPWRQKCPDVEVAEVSRCGSPANEVIDASRGASLVVIGRRSAAARSGPTRSRHACGAAPRHRTVAVVAHGRTFPEERRS